MEITSPLESEIKNTSDVVIVGAGLAGMVVALAMEPRPVTLLSLAELGEQSSSALAQGGLAAVLGAGDTPESHSADTLAAGAGRCDPAVVAFVVRAGAAAVARLESWGVRFARDAAGQFDLHLEAAHAARRIAHISGDGTGAGIVVALAARVRAAAWITVRENVVVTSLLRDSDGIVGVVTDQAVIPASQVVLATGGAGALWRETTAPLESWGRGIALAEQVGAVLRDLCFVQFHPTGLDVGRDPFPLVSEAVRGEGAVLVDAQGKRILESDLAPRDVVARGIWAALRGKSSQGDRNNGNTARRVFLDARKIEGFATRFPRITSFCAAAGLDPSRDLLPVRPVAHYHMGGVRVDHDGRTSVRGLWAVGEVASTGLHGANRLASNSLLEAAVFGVRIGEILRDEERGAGASPVLSSEDLARLASFARPVAQDRTAIRAVMTEDVGVTRDGVGLARACAALAPLAERSAMGRVALLIAQDALAQCESVGSHWRDDFSVSRVA